MKTIKRLLIGILFVVTGLVIWKLAPIVPPVLNNTLDSEVFGSIEIAQPAWGEPQGLILAFVDSNKTPARELSKQLATKGVVAKVVDVGHFFNNLKSISGQCVEAKQVVDSIDGLLKGLPEPKGKPPIIAGIGEGRDRLHSPRFMDRCAKGLDTRFLLSRSHARADADRS